MTWQRKSRQAGSPRFDHPRFRPPSLSPSLPPSLPPYLLQDQTPRGRRRERVVILHHPLPHGRGQEGNPCAGHQGAELIYREEGREGGRDGGTEG